MEYRIKEEIRELKRTIHEMKKEIYELKAITKQSTPLPPEKKPDHGQPKSGSPALV
jgi:predicted RNase H-like nuclease (RuvC/YqgF family)